MLPVLNVVIFVLDLVNKYSIPERTRAQLTDGEGVVNVMAQPLRIVAPLCSLWAVPGFLLASAH